MEIKKGTRVGLNKKIRSYYFQGDNGINLREGIEDTVIIPDDISDKNLEMIKRSVRSGTLVLGWSPEIKPDVRFQEDDRKILDNGVRKIFDILDEISKTSGTKKDSPAYRLERLSSWEKEGKNRVSVIRKIEKLLSNIGGISFVEESEKEEIKIDLA